MSSAQLISCPQPNSWISHHRYSGWSYLPKQLHFCCWSVLTHSWRRSGFHTFHELFFSSPHSSCRRCRSEEFHLYSSLLQICTHKNYGFDIWLRRFGVRQRDSGLELRSHQDAPVISWHRLLELSGSHFPYFNTFGNGHKKRCKYQSDGAPLRTELLQIHPIVKKGVNRAVQGKLPETFWHEIAQKKICSTTYGVRLFAMRIEPSGPGSGVLNSRVV